MSLRPTGRALAVLALATLILQLAAPTPAGPGSGGPSEGSVDVERPNLLLIVSDDQRHGSMDLMPTTEALIFEEGVRFPNAFVTTPVCCPSRSSILTGRHAHNHGVLANTDPLTVPTVVQALQDAGYWTGHVGKYLNSWDGSNRSEFDRWVAFPGGDSPYTDPTLHIGDRVVESQGYITELLADQATGFIREAASRDQPFFLHVAPNAPHRPAIPAPQDRGALADAAPHRPPSYAENDTSDKPRWVQAETLSAGDRRNIDTWHTNMSETLLGLDRAVADIHQALEETGELDTTAIIYLSDNGFLWGEHGLVGKGDPYEESVRVPMALAYPPLTHGESPRAEVVANIDIAPTLYELADLPIPETVDGRSLVDLLTGEDPWRRGILLQGWVPGRPWRAMHTGQDVYIETDGDLEEYYDLSTDPYQLENLYEDREHRDRVRELDRLLEQRVRWTHATPWPDEGP